MSEFDVEGWRRELEQYREQKDEAFRSQRGSPVPPEERDDFGGLSYFEPDPDYRVEASIEDAEGEDTIRMETTADTEVEYERVARLRFDLRGEEHSLVAYRQASGGSAGGEDNSLFVPFRDKTTGQQTYPAGRYMEFEIEGNLDDADGVTVDFNVVYFPFCAYSEAFSCPLPPEENWLDVEVLAGEKFADA